MSTTFTQILIPATTEAVISPQFGLAADDSSLTLSSFGYAGVEAAVLEILDESTGSPVWAPVKFNSVGYQLDINTNTLDIWQDWGIYRLNKSATVAAVGVTLRRLQ